MSAAERAAALAAEGAAIQAAVVERRTISVDLGPDGAGTPAVAVETFEASAPLPPDSPATAAPAREHDGFDLGIATLDEQRAAELGEAAVAALHTAGVAATGRWRAVVERLCVATGAGLQAQDAVTWVQALVGDDDAGWSVTRAARAAGGIPWAELAAEAAEAATAAAGASDRTAAAMASPASGEPAATAAARAPSAPGAAAAAPVAGEPAAATTTSPVVYGPDALATLLRVLGELGFNGLAVAEGRSPLAGRLGARVAASSINLSDSPRFGHTIPRSRDAEGTPKAPIPLIQDGVAHRVVHDTRSAALGGGSGATSTGHALTPGGLPGGPVPTNLVLVGGGAVDLAELAAPIAHGLYVPALELLEADAATTAVRARARGARRIEHGRLGPHAGPLEIHDSALRTLAAVQALTMRQRLVLSPPPDGALPLVVATVCPAVHVADVPIAGTR